MNWLVYILKSLKDDKYYIGSTSDLNARIKRHNTGGNRSTKHRRPLVLVYSEKCVDQSSSFNREKQIKSYKGGEAFKKLIGVGGRVVKCNRL